MCDEQGDSGGVRAPMVPDTPLAAGVIRGAFRISEHARDGTEVLDVSTPSTVTGGPDQLRGIEHLHDRSVGQGIMWQLKLVGPRVGVRAKG